MFSFSVPCIVWILTRPDVQAVFACMTVPLKSHLSVVGPHPGLPDLMQIVLSDDCKFKDTPQCLL